MADRPSSFHRDLISDWAQWVLAHGLPALPDALESDSALPVARRAGRRFGAVMYVEWGYLGEEGEEDEIWNEILLFRRTEAGWEAANGSGGSTWIDPPFTPPPLDADEVAFGGEFIATQEAWSCCGIDGFVGTDCAVIEVEQADLTERMAVESPLGAVIVAIDPSKPAIIRGIDAAGATLSELDFDGYGSVR